MEKEPGYKNLIVWKNTRTLRGLIYQMCKGFPQAEMRRSSQMRDSARSVKQNIQEGYVKSLPSYINHLNIAMGSLSELRGDIDDCLEDRLITKENFLSINELAGKTEYLLKRLIQSLIRKRDSR
ncbi:MAG TPA: four helix bundle protein [Candidatus Omnitrophota bacterium]|nr:four helix bundle protein [Candidatus Omnitrophota bacterium]HPD85634.1 four helix bundle protein [Candidatus Omnitrophota bacterium]HRZ04477.1 four helix bundle protein [Candidatus Omnitrophota bacterium]